MARRPATSRCPTDLPGMAVRNSDDFVPALGGPQVDDSRLQVERQAYPPGSAIPTDQPAPAHQRSAYVTTAQAVDRAGSSQVREQVAAMDSFTGDYTAARGSTITSYRYHAVRLPDGVPGRWDPGAAGQPAEGRPVNGRSTSADQPADDADHQCAENSPPEVLDVQAEAEEAADPGDEQEQQPVDDERDEAERQDVERERDDPDQRADDAVDQAEDRAPPAGRSRTSVHRCRRPRR